MDIVQHHAELYEGLWSSVQPYADVSPGETNLALFLAMSGAATGTVLDAGTGSGKGAVALEKAGFTVTLCDLTCEGLTAEAKAVGPAFGGVCLWHDLRPLVSLDRVARNAWEERETFDWVYCCDVLEHVPTEYTMLTIHRLLEVAANGVFLTIALIPDQFGVWVGEPLHQTVQPFTWWRDRLRDLGRVIECRDCLHYGAYLVTRT